MGFKIQSLVNFKFQDYDHNKNGIIDYQNGNESTRLDERTVKKGNTYGTDQVLVTHKKMFQDADRNKDGKVTKLELTKLMGKFDRNHNNELELRDFVDWMFNENKDRAEHRDFIRAYPEREVK